MGFLQTTFRGGICIYTSTLLFGYAVAEGDLLADAVCAVLDDDLLGLVDAHALTFDTDAYVVEFVDELTSEGGDTAR